MKTRIKIVTKNDGSKVYIPQYCVWKFFWYEYTEDGWWSLTCDTLEEAQKVIDNHLASIDENKLRRYNNKVKFVEYVKYP